MSCLPEHDPGDFFYFSVTRALSFSCIVVKGLIDTESEEKVVEDEQIIKLYWARSEDAITQTARKYGSYCHTIAYNILHNNEDSEECVNDTWLKTWGSLPPHRPRKLSAFLGKITRNLSLDRYRNYTAEKRGAGQPVLALEELSGCVPDTDGTERILDEMELTELLDRFLASLTPENRKYFMRRYWYFSSVSQIAADYGLTESKVKMSLLRSRNKLREMMEKEGVSL